MNLKHQTARLALGALLFAGALACRTADVFIAQATLTPTRTPHPTFTPLPPLTDTPEPTSTLAPTPTPTKKPTTRPVVRTATPVPPTPVPQPTRSPYDYKVTQIICKHSGQSFVEGLVLASSDTSSGINGIPVRMSASPGGAAAGPDYTTTDHDGLPGYFSFIVNAYGAARDQVRYVWIVDASGSAKSDPNAGKAAFNDKPETAPDSCWNIQILFVKTQ